MIIVNDDLAQQNQLLDSKKAFQIATETQLQAIERETMCGLCGGIPKEIPSPEQNHGAYLTNAIDREVEKCKTERVGGATHAQPETVGAGFIEKLIDREAAAAQKDLQAFEASKPRIKHY